MEIESEIFDKAPTKVETSDDFHSFKLLKTTAYASLYEAHKAGKRFLIKTTKDNSERQFAMLRREYELSIGCDHPHIVHVYTFEPNLPIGAGIVMEYIDGENLAEYLTKQHPVGERKQLVEELISAVEYLHKRGIIHNDLKPENILISRAANSLKLIDFGLADSDVEFAMRRLGCTPRYSSPELRAESPETDARSDIYSIGIILREILGEDYARIVKKCCAERPEERYPSLEALRRDLNHRNNRWQRIAMSVVAVIILLPTLLLTYSKIELYKRVSLRDRTLAQIEHTVDSLCLVALDSIKHSTYIEFGGIHLQQLSERCLTFNDRIIASTSDAELQAIYVTRFNDIYRRHWSVITEQFSTLPSYHTVEPIEAWPYFDSLVEHKLPFRPYIPKGPKDNKRQ